MMMTTDRPTTAMTPQESLLQTAPPMQPQLPPTKIPTARALFALLHRELRPAAGILVIQWIFAAAAAVLLYYAHLYLVYLYAGFGLSILLYPPFLVIAPILFALCGLTVGALQPLADRDPDLWAFLYHRPVPRHLHATARVLAGAILYTLGAGLSYLLVILLAATRTAGNFFILAFVYPSLATFVLGFVTYLAGLLTVQRRARWYASKFLPLLIPLIAARALYAFRQFDEVLLLLFALAALLFAANIAAAATRGFTLRTPAWAKAILAATLLLALTLPAAELTARLNDRINLNENIAWNTLDRQAPHFTYPPNPDSNISREYVLLFDGSVIIRTTTLNAHNGDQASTYTDLQNNPVPAPEKTPTSYSLSAVTTPNADLLSSDYHYPQWLVSTYSGADAVTHRPSETWYFTHGLFYGYADASHAPVGVLGRTGLAFPGHPAEPFDDDTAFLFHYPMYGRSVYQLDLDTRTVRHLFTAPAPIVHSYGVGDPLFLGMTHAPTILATSLSRIYILNFLTGDVLSSFPIEPSLSHGEVNLIPLPDLHQVVLWHPYAAAGSMGEFFTPEGDYLKTITLPALSTPFTNKALEFAIQKDYDQFLRSRLANPIILQQAAVEDHATRMRGLNAALLGYLPLRTLNLIERHIDPAAGPPAALAWNFLLPFTALTTAALAATLLLARRRLSKKAAAAWSLVTLAFGPIAPLTLLLTTSTRMTKPS